MQNKIIIILFLFFANFVAVATEYSFLKNPNLTQQLTYPQKIDRPTIGLLGYNLKFSDKYLPGFRIGQLLTPGKYGIHSYSVPSVSEFNGQIYTCRGGFIDSSHLRAGVDWTAHFTLQIELYQLKGKEIVHKSEGGELILNIHKQKMPLKSDEIIEMAQQMAFLRLTWHEIVSWYYHLPMHFLAEQRSTLSPEDSYSNLLGTYVGADALKLMRNDISMSYSKAVDVSFNNWLTFLSVVASKDDTRNAMKHIDRALQNQLGVPISMPAWYDSDIEVEDQRYLFKRYINIFNTIDPWLIQNTSLVNCSNHKNSIEYYNPHPLKIPQFNSLSEIKYSDTYDFIIKPYSKLYTNNGGEGFFEGTNIRKYNHRPLPDSFHINKVDELKNVIEIIRIEMAEIFGKGFDDPNVYNGIPLH